MQRRPKTPVTLHPLQLEQVLSEEGGAKVFDSKSLLSTSLVCGEWLPAHRHPWDQFRRLGKLRAQVTQLDSCADTSRTPDGTFHWSVCASKWVSICSAMHHI